MEIFYLLFHSLRCNWFHSNKVFFSILNVFYKQTDINGFIHSTITFSTALFSFSERNKARTNLLSRAEGKKEREKEIKCDFRKSKPEIFYFLICAIWFSRVWHLRFRLFFFYFFSSCSTTNLVENDSISRVKIFD